MVNLTEDEKAILKMYKAYDVRKGLGLTLTILQAELAYPVGDRLETALQSLIQKKLLAETPHLKELYIITHKGIHALTILANS